MSVGGNTLFLTRTDGKKIVAPLNDCDESVYTGILTIPPSEISGSQRLNALSLKDSASVVLPLPISLNGIYSAGKTTTYS